VPAEISHTTFTWLKRETDWRVDWYSLNGGVDNYWGGVNGGLPDDPNTPSSQGTAIPAFAGIAAGSTETWSADIDGSGADSATTIYGYHQVCLDITLIGGGFAGSDLLCVNKCAAYIGGATPTPTP